jgi:hypothetical protein
MASFIYLLLYKPAIHTYSISLFFLFSVAKIRDNINPEYRGSIILRNVGAHLPGYGMVSFLFMVYLTTLSLAQDI